MAYSPTSRRTWAPRCCRDGGENHDARGRFALAVPQSLRAGDPAAAASRLQQVAANPNLRSHARTFIRVPEAVVAGSRDRTLADVPDLDDVMAPEILFLINPRKPPPDSIAACSAFRPPGAAGPSHLTITSRKENRNRDQKRPPIPSDSRPNRPRGVRHLAPTHSYLIHFVFLPPFSCPLPA